MDGIYVDGRRAAGRGEAVELVDPATGERDETLVQGSAATSDGAVAAAHAA